MLKCIISVLAVAGDYEAVLLLLLIPRIIAKTELLITQMREKVTNIDFFPLIYFVMKFIFVVTLSPESLCCINLDLL